MCNKPAIMDTPNGELGSTNKPAIMDTPNGDELGSLRSQLVRISRSIVEKWFIVSLDTPVSTKTCILESGLTFNPGLNLD